MEKHTYSNIDNEIWKSVKKHLNYSVSNMGRVKNKNTGRILLRNHF